MHPIAQSHHSKGACVNLTRSRGPSCFWQVTMHRLSMALIYSSITVLPLFDSSPRCSIKTPDTPIGSSDVMGGVWPLPREKKAAYKLKPKRTNNWRIL